MTSPHFADHRRHLDALQRAALEAADPEAAVARNLSLEGPALRVGDNTLPLVPGARLVLVALGKAAAGMSRMAACILGQRLTAGVAAVPRSWPGAAPEGFLFMPGGHPLPDEGSLAAGLAAAALVSGLSRQDVLLALVSGGGSAMMELPVTGVSRDDLRAVNHLLLASGAPIETINTVRRALSRLKGGGLARLAAPATTAALILSDVMGDRLSAVASGPTVLRPLDASPCRRILQTLGLWDRVAPSVRTALERQPPPPRRTPRPLNVLAGNNRLMLEAAGAEAHRLGFQTEIVTLRLRGEAAAAGQRLAARLRRASAPACLLFGGETTVSVHGSGRGGRNQELALSAALALDGLADAALMALASDGVDGPTNAAGAVVSGQTAATARRLGLDIQAALDAHDSYPLLDRLGCLIRTGPTGTNLGDLVVGLASPSSGPD